MNINGERLLEPKIVRYTTTTTNRPTKGIIIKTGGGRLYGITNTIPQPGKTVRVYDGTNLWFVKRLDEAFEMYTPLRAKGLITEYEEFIYSLSIETDSATELLYFYA